MHARRLLAWLPFLMGALTALVPDFALAAQTAKAPPPSIGVSPSRLEIALDRPTTMGSATVLNLSDRDIEVRTSIVSFDLDEDNDFRELPTEPGSLATSMMVNPATFTIPAHGSQTVRFAIARQRLDGEGEHRAMLFFSELVDTSHAAVKINFRLGLPIYAQVGEPDRQAVVHDLDLDPEALALDVDLSAVGNAQVRPTGYYAWWPADELGNSDRVLKKVARLAENTAAAQEDSVSGARIVASPVFPGTRRTLTIPLEPPPDDGSYKLVVYLKTGKRTLERVLDYAPSQMLVVDRNR